MSCCLESAILTALRALACSPIRSENHFILERKCEDCIPYVVVKVSETTGLRTSSAVQKISTIEIAAYFSGDKESQAFEYRDILETWLYVPDCVDLGDCGCICLRGPVSTSTIKTNNGLNKLSFRFSGSFMPAAVGSGSV